MSGQDRAVESLGRNPSDKVRRGTLMCWTLTSCGKGSVFPRRDSEMLRFGESGSSKGGSGKVAK